MELVPTDYTLVDLAKDATILIGIILALYNVNCWRRTLIGTRRLDVLQEALSLYYEARDVLEAIRSPLGYESEGGKRQPLPSESPQLSAFLDEAYVIAKRYESRAELFAKARSIQYKLRTIIGPDAAEPCELMNEAVRDVRYVMTRLQRWSQRYCISRRKDQFETAEMPSEELDRILYGDPEDDKAEKAVACLESLAKREELGRVRNYLARILGWAPCRGRRARP